MPNNPKTIKEIADNLVRDLCSVEFRSKSKTRELVESYKLSLLDEVENKMIDNNDKLMAYAREHWENYETVIGANFAVAQVNDLIEFLSDLREK